VARSAARSGFGLHGGACSVELVAEPGPVRLERDGKARPLEAFRVANARFSTTLACDAFAVGTTEHLLAAFAGLGVRGGVRARIAGDELPILDGGARAFASAVEELGLEPQAPALRVARPETLEVDGSTYSFFPGDGVCVEVEVDLPPGCAREAAWRGDAEAFVARVAPARMFLVERDAAEAARLGLGRRVSPESVLVVSDRGVHGAGSPEADEPARHKLLDLLGDAYVHGGPPRGRLCATRPGHARNHAAFERAIALGVLVKGPA
jgi:UDP-3-O-[3-hydroxymyristoyl] N-acetylglucosamine deacetylase